ncbi:MAG: transcription-repair coupling factor [Gemmatimonadales bacterium]
MLTGVRDRVMQLPAYRALRGAVPGRGRVLSVAGLPGASPAVVVAGLAADAPQQIIVVVTRLPQDAERWEADLTQFTEAVRLYPQREAMGLEEPHVEIAGERVEALADLERGAIRLLVTTLRATQERTMMPGAVTAGRVTLARGGRERLTDVVGRLAAVGYTRVPTVTDVGQCAVRGGLLDVYGFGMAAPARIEWWGDEILSLRAFDLDTQRSEAEVDDIAILPMRSRTSDGSDPQPTDLLALLPPDTLIVVDHDVDVADVERVWDEATHHVDVARRLGDDVPPRDEWFLSPADWRERWGKRARLALRSHGADVDMHLGVPEGVDRDLAQLAARARRRPVLVLCDNNGQLERLDELLSDAHGMLAPGLALALGSLSGGFTLPELEIVTDHELFRRQRRLRRPRRYRQALAPMAVPLAAGDAVVHLEHGIGLYRGIETITTGRGALEVAVVEYEGGDRLNVPLYRIDQLDRYRAPGTDEGTPPRLDRLGGTRWRRQREKAERAVRQLAAELMDLYARRSVAPGFAFPSDGRWQRELESAFLYEDTTDQRAATEAVKRDMERPRPMDRLVVGDVGYGKTEVAVRAAFKAVQGGRQVAVLVPTTILAEQHGRTFADRLAEFPVRVAVLSRFRTTAEQDATVKGLADGTIDIVIGTHRVLSADVTFQRLGLLVVDEEHRFGVRHKERLKALRLSVDVLTLTATPIPRTLHVALAGLRDLTLIETPPRDRSPVLTFVEPWDDGLLEEALARELDRGGQVYFVHNRIETIGSMAERVERLAPRARVAIGHGQMKERDLDEVMRRFVGGAVDVLVSTMIVESGLDVANANTMIVHRADQFGLAQLYQLRGRVGRGHRRAYCYLLVPDAVDAEAEERLRVLEHHTALGSGYRIAMRDLEIRGAGNLLGAEQSGHAQAVGFDTYMRWLAESVRALEGGGPVSFPPPDVTLDAPARLPEAYVPDEDAKLELYRRLARADELGEIARLRDELRDRFGPLPPEADHLLLVAALRVVGTRLGIESILIRGNEARVSFRAGATPRLARLTAALDDVQFAADVRRTMPLHLRLARLGGMPVAQGLLKALTAATADADAPAGVLS